MHSLAPSPSLLGAAALAIFLPLAAHAQLSLSGRASGEFTGTPGTYDTIDNAPDRSFASFKSGVPEHASDLQTSIVFNQHPFSNAGPGVIATDLFKITNGRTLLGTTAAAAHFNLWVDLTAPSTQSHLLTGIPFSIVNTPNGPDPRSVDDAFAISAGPIDPFQVGNYRVQFSFTAPPSFTIAENQSRDVGTLSVAFTPVPEPATFALVAAALLIGLMALRSLRAQRTRPA